MLTTYKETYEHNYKSNHQLFEKKLLIPCKKKGCCENGRGIKGSVIDWQMGFKKLREKEQICLGLG